MSTQGERGPTGDHGQQGEQGSEGVRGVQGETGIQGLLGQGERGKQGDHGQDGREGARGHQGETGVQGVPGARGEQGEAPGGALRLTDRRLLVLYILLAAGLILLAVRSETNAREIQSNQNRISASNFERCVDVAKIQTKFNVFLDALAGIDKDNANITEDIRARRLEAYEAARLNVPANACDDLQVSGR